MDTFLERRGEVGEATAARLDELRREYSQFRRSVTSAYRAVRDHFIRFLQAEPQYDLRGEMFDDGPPIDEIPLDYPLANWWKPITFDEAVNTWANAEDDHIRHYLARQQAVLDAFQDWLGDPTNHRLAGDLAGANREDDEILALVRRQLDLQERHDRVQRKAAIFTRQGQISGAEHFDTYTFAATNSGPAPARSVRAWAANGAGERVSSVADLQALAPDNQWLEFNLEILPAISRAGGLSLVIAWADGDGDHEEAVMEIRKL